MANFENALNKTLIHEGGYVFDLDDPGGETYKGIARNSNNTWTGWQTIDSLKKQPNFPKNMDTNTVLQENIKSFYKANYWDTINGNDIQNQAVADSIFDFAVNAGVKTSAKMVQTIIGTSPDGNIGPASLAKLNTFDSEYFLALFKVAKIERYMEIVKKRPTSSKFLYGWIKRTISKSA